MSYSGLHLLASVSTATRKGLISDLLNDRSDMRSMYIDNMALSGVAVTSLMHCISADCLPVRVYGVMRSHQGGWLRGRALPLCRQIGAGSYVESRLQASARPLQGRIACRWVGM